MLRKLEEKELDKYIDMMYELACDFTKSSYPTYNDGVETKETFVLDSKKAFIQDDAEILLFCDEDKVLGWIHYYFIADDNYLATASMQASNKFDLMLAEFEQYVVDNYPSYDIWLGFSSQNIIAINYVEAQGYKQHGHLQHTMLHLDDYEFIEENKHASTLTMDEYEAFGLLHDSVNSDEMYWNSERIKNNFDKWNILTYKKDTELLGAIYCVNKTISEIFGVDFTDDTYNDVVFEALLVGIANRCKENGTKYLCYFCENNQLDTVKKLGFSHIDEYKGYVKKARNENV